jgi:hypothetical protein
VSILAAPLLLSLLLPAEDKPAPKMPLGKATTFVTGPLDREGYVDYEAALNDLLGQGITPDKNANVLLWKVFGPTPDGGRRMPAEFFKRLGMEGPSKDGTFISLGHYLKDHVKLDREQWNDVIEQQGRSSARPWAAKDYPHIAAWLKVNEKPLDLAVRATRRPEYFNPLVYHTNEKGPGALLGALLPSLQKCRELASALTARAMLRVAAGQHDEAWQDLLACHRLGRLVGRGATLIEALVGIAIDAVASNADLAFLESANLTSRQALACLKDLQALPPMPPLADKVHLAERFMLLDSVQLVRRRGIGMLEVLAGGLPKGTSPEELKALALVDWAPALRNSNRWFDRLAAAMRLKDRAEREKALSKIDTDLAAVRMAARERANVVKLVLGKGPPDKDAGKVIGDILIGLELPSTRKVQTAHDRAEQIERNLRVAFALAAYRADHRRYPARLDDLAPKYLAAVPGDLFSDQARRWR